MITSGSTIIAIIPVRLEDPVLTLSIRGRPVIDWTVRRLRTAQRIGGVVLAVDGGSAPGALAAPDTLHVRPAPTVATGADRLGAIRAALSAGGPADAVLLCAPDRALGPASIVADLLDQCDDVDAVAAARPVRSTLKRVVDGRVVATVPRDAWRSDAGPWLFHRDALDGALAAAAVAGRSVVDGQDLALAGGLRVRLIDADASDLPIRTPADARFAERWLASTVGRTGGVTG